MTHRRSGRSQRRDERCSSHVPDARSLGELFSDLTREVGTLIRTELALARTELSEKAARVGRHAAVIAGVAVLACGGVFAVIAGFVLLVIRAGVPAWAAAMVVGAAVIAAGAVVAGSGLSSLRREDLAPRETLNTLKETATWKS